MAGFAAVAVVVVWLAIPEMKGRTPMEIDRMFSLRLRTRDFKSWNSDVSLRTETEETHPPVKA
jgi:hypothetical protein